MNMEETNLNLQEKYKMYKSNIVDSIKDFLDGIDALLGEKDELIATQSKTICDQSDSLLKKDNELSGCREKIEQKEGKIKSLEKMATQKDEEIGKLGREIESLQTTVTQKEEKIGRLGNEIDSLQTIVTQKKEEIGRLGSEIESFRTTITQKDKELEEKQTQAEQDKIKIEELNKAKESLQNEKTELNTKLEAATTDLNNKKQAKDKQCEYDILSLVQEFTNIKNIYDEGNLNDSEFSRILFNVTCIDNWIKQLRIADFNIDDWDFPKILSDFIRSNEFLKIIQLYLYCKETSISNDLQEKMKVDRFITVFENIRHIFSANQIKLLLPTLFVSVMDDEKYNYESFNDITQIGNYANSAKDNRIIDLCKVGYEIKGKIIKPKVFYKS